MLKRTEGIVLRSRPLGEADLILEYLTRDFGIQSAFAKSPRKIKSRFGGSLEPFTHARVAFLGKEEARLPKLTQSDIIRPFQSLREDVKIFYLASELAEITLKLLPEKEPNEKIFNLMLWLLDLLEQGEDTDHIIPLVFKLRLIALSGYAPALKGCVKCGKETRKFYPLDGALICEACKSGAGFIEVSPGFLRLYDDLSSWPLEKITRIKPSQPLMSELRHFVEAHLKDVVAIKTKTGQGRKN